jgi:hypothetical protein
LSPSESLLDERAFLPYRMIRCICMELERSFSLAGLIYRKLDLA